MRILEALKGINGTYEVQRVLGAFGTVVFTVSVPALVAADVIKASLEGFCLAYPAGIATLVGTTAGAIALKDRQVAKAKVEERAA